MNSVETKPFKVWVRPKNLAIQQDLRELARIKHFDFDLDDPQFVRYFLARTGYDLVNTGLDEETGKRASWKQVKKWALHPPNDVWKITRSKLQDCWEIFQRLPAQMKPKMKQAWFKL